MKNSFKNIAVAFAFVTAFAFSAQAEETKKASSINTGVYVNKEGKINVLVDKANNNASTTLMIRNEAGEVVYKEVVAKGNQKFRRVLNVEELSSGNYEIEVISKNEIQSKSFKLEDPKTERVLTVE